MSDIDPDDLWAIDAALTMTASAATVVLGRGGTQDEAITVVLAALTPERIAERMDFLRRTTEVEQLESDVYGPEVAERMRKKREDAWFAEQIQRVHDAGEDEA